MRETSVPADWRMNHVRKRLAGACDKLGRVSLTGNSWFDPLTGNRAENKITTPSQTQKQNPDSVATSPETGLP